MTRVRPGWLVALCALVLAVSSWLPWLISSADGGGRATGIGGTVGTFDLLPARFGVGQLVVLLTSALVVAAAMTARGLSARWSAGVALGLSLLIAGLMVWYHLHYVGGPVSAGYGFYIGVAGVVGAVGFSVWSLVAALRDGRLR